MEQEHWILHQFREFYNIVIGVTVINCDCSLDAFSRTFDLGFAYFFNTFGCCYVKHPILLQLIITAIVGLIGTYFLQWWMRPPAYSVYCEGAGGKAEAGKPYTLKFRKDGFLMRGSKILFKDLVDVRVGTHNFNFGVKTPSGVDKYQFVTQKGHYIRFLLSKTGLPVQLITT